MIVTVLFVVAMFLWLLTLLPSPAIAPFGWASSWLAWISVLMLGLFILLPAMR